jgi:hypothetical protein
MAKRARSRHDDDYEVGYGKPPREFQFQKGTSGYPGGRPKGSRNIKRMITKRLMTLVTVRENGKARRIPTMEALVVKALNEALQGRPKPFIDICKLLEGAGIFSLGELDEPIPSFRDMRVTVQIVRPRPRPGDPNYVTQLDKSDVLQVNPGLKED